MSDKEPPKAKDRCAGCEHPEVLSMLLPRIEELEKRVKIHEEYFHKVSKMKFIDGDILQCIDYKLHELEKKVKEIENR